MDNKKGWEDIAEEFTQAAATNIDAVDLKSQIKDRFKQDTKHRAFLTIWVVIATSCWILSVVGIILFQGFKINNFTLSDTVLTVLLTTTTLNILGLPYIVLKGFFKSEIKQ